MLLPTSPSHGYKVSGYAVGIVESVYKSLCKYLADFLDRLNVPKVSKAK